MYSIDQLNKDMAELQAEERDIRIDRGKRYGGADDTLENISAFGADGAIVHANECFQRIKNMFGKDKDVADLKNAVQDGRNYLAYVYILAKRKHDRDDMSKPSTGVVPFDGGGS